MLNNDEKGVVGKGDVKLFYFLVLGILFLFILLLTNYSSSTRIGGMKNRLRFPVTGLELKQTGVQQLSLQSANS